MTHALSSLNALAYSPLGATLRAALDTESLIADTIAVQQIPAPTFDEAQRAAYVARRFEAARLCNVSQDALDNVYGRWPGEDATAPALLICAHTDTVFPAETDLTARRVQDCIFAPGIGDNSLGVAGLLALSRLWRVADYRPPADVWFVANTREEGLGNLGGIRAVLERLGGRLGSAIVVEGMALGRVYHVGIAVRRLRVMCTTPGGHSWTHFGQPSAIHELILAGSRITRLTPPTEPRTTLNIGLISGGQSVNSLASSAEFYLDLRSEDAATLAAWEARVCNQLTSDHRPAVKFDVEVVGDRPSGGIPVDHPLVQLASASLEAIGLRPHLQTGSTDANALLAAGLPTVTIGLTTGGNAHRVDEYIEVGPLADGLWHLTLLATAASQRAAEWSHPGA